MGRGKRKQSVILAFLAKKVPVWGLLLAVLGGFVCWNFGYRTFIADNSRARITIEYLEKVNEVVFLNTGIKEVVTDSNVSDIFGIQIPFTEKKVLVILNYKAKFGIKNAVEIQKEKEKKYKVIIPKLEVIGVELAKDHPYELYDRQGELLSATTKDVDTGALAMQQLTNERQKAILENYKEDIKESAITYYTSLFQAIDPEIKISVEFSE
ncbi:DUF4230 domain-containing protein [Streptococcus sp. DD13]|uniref:DUF4230 domain-containing protein n=1 Tax=Streptococcus sp. DD13 TaxID=1777881 RepID=UPI0007957832|nr:DUF4230 domain-containing protein [Streptococcus sp. DD13]KXT77586.1 hypothetical protein STRDD13_01457 [Streptococcus sp. DD13]